MEGRGPRLGPGLLFLSNECAEALMNQRNRVLSRRESIVQWDR